MTDNEIISALEYCNDCSANLNNVEIIGLINSQQIDNERLKKLLEEADINYNKYVRWVYKEAIKEFAYRLKQKSEYYENGQGWEGRICYEDDIDKLLKEMVGDTE